MGLRENKVKSGSLGVEVSTREDGGGGGERKEGEESERTRKRLKILVK